ncbi:MAG TPA: 2-iminoacetate synthase ThiH [Verrucomicrobiales bacterium]|nr:2-iminoacetate synthase ThiH [Verrucomicrobiales bacterium]
MPEYRYSSVFPFDITPRKSDHSFPVSFSAFFADPRRGHSPLLRRFASMLEPVSAGKLESMARQSSGLSKRQFGNTMRLFAPLYLSNECVNNCTYCGFSRDNPILRTTLELDQVAAEAAHLHSLGFRNLLLVAGEHPKFVSEGYLQDCLRILSPSIPTLGIEVGPMKDSQYAELVSCGAEGLIVYQETYHRETYETLHTSGPKRKFDWRLDCPERAYAGGFRRIGIGALFGLADWRTEALALATHLEYLYRTCWKAQFSISFPRMRPHAGNHRHELDPGLTLSDRHLVQLICAFRLSFPQVSIVLSTREPAFLRDHLFSLGVTHVSAGSHTEPGGYTGVGSNDLHRTIRGRRVEIEPEERALNGCSTKATPQFEIDDDRSVAAVADQLVNQGFDPVWKDWDREILAPANP